MATTSSLMPTTGAATTSPSSSAAAAADVDEEPVVSAETQPAVFTEQGRHLKKRIELRKKLEAKKAAEAAGAAADPKKLEEAEAQKSVLAKAVAEEIEAKIEEEKAPEAPREKVKVGKKMMVTTEGKLDAKESLRIQSLISAGKAGTVKAFSQEEGVTKELSDHDPSSVLVFVGCKKCDYNVTSICTKIFVEKCEDFVLRLNGKVVTQTVECYKLERANLLINTKIGTLQVEQSEKVNVIYGEKEHFGAYMIWAGAFLLRLQIGTDPATADLMRCDFGLTQQVDPTVNLERTQFKCWYDARGKLVCDKIIRLKNGFPTTAREDANFDRKQEQQLSALADRMGITLNRKEDNVGGRIKPNDICPCGSGKKYKKCCRV